MASNLTIMGNKEILLVAENIAHEKGILLQEVIEAMEEGIKLAAKKKFGGNLDIECRIDKKTGQIKLFNKLQVVEDDDEYFDMRTQITLKHAKQEDPEAEIGDSVVQELPPIDLSRVVAQVARNEIIRKVKEAEKKLETNQKALEAELEPRGKNIAERNAAVIESYKNARGNLANVTYLEGLTTTNPNAFGVLQHPTVAAAIGKVMEAGATTGAGRTEIGNLDDAVRAAMKGSKESDIIAAQKATNKFAELQLNAAKVLLKGQGAVSDNERLLVEKMTGSVRNSPAAIRDFLGFVRLRSAYDQEIGAAQKAWERQNPNKSYREFELSNDYERISNAYSDKVDAFAEKAGNYTPPKGPVVKPSGYDAWKKSQQKGTP
jgi:hypothetical protein